MKENESNLVNKNLAVIFTHSYRTLFAPTELFKALFYFSFSVKKLCCSLTPTNIPQCSQEVRTDGTSLWTADKGKQFIRLWPWLAGHE